MPGAYYRQALDLSPPGHPQRPELLARAGRVAFQAGELAEAAAAYEEAIAGLREQGDAHGLGAAMGRLATVRWNQGDTRGATAVLTDAIELLEREPPSPELCAAYEGMAGDRVMSGHAKEALKWADKALTLADQLGGLPELRPRVLDVRGMARCDLGDFGGMDDLRAALALGLELGSGYDTAVIYNNLAEPVWLVDGSTAALDLCQEGIDFAERRGLGRPAMWLRASTLGPLLDLGRWDEALALAGEAIAWDHAHGGDYLAVGCQRYMTLVRLWRGELDAAGVLAAEALPRPGRSTTSSSSCPPWSTPPWSRRPAATGMPPSPWPRRPSGSPPSAPAATGSAASTSRTWSASRPRRRPRSPATWSSGRGRPRPGTAWPR